jgi:Zn-dependent protease
MDIFVWIGGIAIALIAFTLHESAHAYLADALGDPTPRAFGRVTLNPLPHVNLVWTILVPGILIATGGPIIGGAGPTPVVESNFRHPIRDGALVAAAGPLSNLVQAIFWSGLLSVLIHTGVWDAESSGVTVVQIGIFANVLLTVFNFLPIPPLDGSRVMASFLSGEARRAYLSLGNFGYFILLAMVWLVPVVGQALAFLYLTLGQLIATLTQLPVPWIPVALFQS